MGEMKFQDPRTFSPIRMTHGSYQGENVSVAHLQLPLSPRKFRYLKKWRNPHLRKQYGYGRCKGIPTSKIALSGLLVGGFNPFEKYSSKWDSSPGRGGHKKYLKPSPSLVPAFSGLETFGDIWYEQTLVKIKMLVPIAETTFRRSYLGRSPPSQ